MLTASASAAADAGKSHDHETLRIQKNKRGKFKFHMPGGPVKAYLETLYELGVKPNPDQVSKGQTR